MSNASKTKTDGNNSRSAGNRPAMTMNVGGVRAAVWANSSEDGRTYHTVTVTKPYKDDDGNWHEATNFGRDDLPKVELATRKAFEYIHLEADIKRGSGSFVDRVTQSEEMDLAV